jgi:hypothetical protein
MGLFLGLLISFFQFLGPGGVALAQEDDYDIPPPPPIMDDYDDAAPYIEEVPPDEDIQGPVYDSIPPPPPMDSGVTNLPDDSGTSSNDSGTTSSSPRRFGFTPPNLRPRGASSPSGGGNFGKSDGKMRFQVEDGVFWEKGKKRGRSDHPDGF